MLVKFIYRVFYNEANEYSICKYRDIEADKTVTCIGTALPTLKNLTYEFEVNETVSARYGVNYNVISYREVVDLTETGIIEYLASGFFAGVSKKTAEKIYKKFGKDTLDILDSDIDRLIDVPGIGAKTLKKIKQSYIEKRASREIAETLLKYGISMSLINKIYRAYKAEAVEVINTRPYDLLRVWGLTFYDVDIIARDQGFALTSYERIKAAATYVLTQDMSKGNVCMPKCDFAASLINLLNTAEINKTNVLDYIIKMIQDGTIYYNKRKYQEETKEYFYLPAAYNAEKDIANRLNILLASRKRTVKNIDKLIDKYSGKVVLDDSQREAIYLGLTEPVFIITGGPGTGKTTILRIIAQINEELEKSRNKCVFLSPTGRAARRITESTGYSASTIHSALRLGVYDDERDEARRGEPEEKIENKHVFVDEASMLDLWVMDSLLKGLSDSTLGLVGDIDQLPSVRCGSILKDMIVSGVIPCVQLEYVHRQGDDAPNIYLNAKHIKEGVHDIASGDDFNIIETKNLAETEDQMVWSALFYIKKYGIDNVKVLCPFKKGEAGVYSINNKLQSIINKSEGLSLKMPNNMFIKIGDPVMQLKNIENVSNGDIGYVKSIDDESVMVDFPNIDVVEYSHSEAKEQLILAYATTVHKSQGSEYDAVIMCLTAEHGVMKRRNILYTGITRGKHCVVLVGDYKAFYSAIDNNMIEDRHSNLAGLLNPYLNETAKKEPVTKTATVYPVYEQMSLSFA